MKRLFLSLALNISLSLLHFGAAGADILTLQHLGRARDGAPRIPVALSQTGGIVAGEERSPAGARPFIWHLYQPQPALVAIPAECRYPQIVAMSGDGAWVVGSCSVADRELAFRASLHIFEFLGGSESWSSPRAVSYDGSVIVGGFIPDTAHLSPQPFVWSAGSGYETIQVSGSEFAEATAVSKDGQTVAVYADQFESFLWTRAHGVTPLGVAASILGMDQYASTLLGSFDEGIGLTRAFVLRGGQLRYLDEDISNGRSTKALAISDEGDLVCGNYSIGFLGRPRPFVWSDKGGFQTLEQYVAMVDPRYESTMQLTELSAMSADGLVMAGIGLAQDLRSEGWILRRTPLAEIDLNHDGVLDSTDVGVFFALWEGGEAVADINLDGGVDGQDVDSFFMAFLRISSISAERARINDDGALDIATLQMGIFAPNA